MLYINIVNKKTSPKRGSVSISSSLLGELEDGLGLVQVPLIIHLCSYQILSFKGSTYATIVSDAFTPPATVL